MRHYNETEVPSVCTNCGFSTRSLGSFMRHTKNCGNNALPIPTTPIEIQLVSDDVVVENVQSCASTASLTLNEPIEHTILQTCDKCDYFSYDNAALTLHCSQEHTDNAELHCDLCNYTCKFKGSMTRHLKYLHKSYSEMTHEIALDESTDQQKKTVKRGRKPRSLTATESSDARKSVESASGKEEDEKKELSTISRSENEEGVACLQCSFVASINENISEHILKVHQKNECSMIETPSTDSGSVERKSSHISFIPQRSVNRKRKLFSCKECSYTSFDRSKYDRHWLYHIIRQTFKCYTCSYSASVEANVQRHILRNHPAVVSRDTIAADDVENTDEKKTGDNIAITSVEGIAIETGMGRDFVDNCNAVVMRNGEIWDNENDKGNTNEDMITGDQSMRLLNGSKNDRVMERSAILPSESEANRPTNIVIKHDYEIDFKDEENSIDGNTSFENKIEALPARKEIELISTEECLNKTDSELEMKNEENKRIQKLITIKKVNNFSEKSGYAKSFLTFAKLKDDCPEMRVVKVKIENTAEENQVSNETHVVNVGVLTANEIHQNVEVVRVKDEIVDRADIIIKKENFTEETREYLSIVGDRTDEEMLKRRVNTEFKECNNDRDIEHRITTSDYASNIPTILTFSSENKNLVAQESNLPNDEKLTRHDKLRNNCDRASLDGSAPDVYIEMFKSPSGITIRQCLSCDKSYTRYGDMNKHTMRCHSRRLKDCIVTRKPQSWTIEPMIPPPITSLHAGKVQENNETGVTPLNGITSPILSSMLISKPGSKLIKDLMSIPPPINSLSKDPMKCAHCPFSSHRIAEIRHHLAGAVKDKYPCRYRPGEGVIPPTCDAFLLPQLIEPQTKADYPVHSQIEPFPKTVIDCSPIKQAILSQGSEINHVAIQPKGPATFKKPVCFVIQPKRITPKVIASCSEPQSNDTIIKTEPHPAADRIVIVDNTERKKVVVKLASKPFAQKFDLRMDNFFSPNNSLLKTSTEPKKQVITIAKRPKTSPSSSLLNLRSLLLLPSSMNVLDNHNQGISSDHSVIITPVRSDSTNSNAVGEDVTLEAVLMNDVSFKEGQRLSDGVNRCERDGCRDGVSLCGRDRCWDEVSPCGRDGCSEEEQSVEYLTSLMCNVCGFMGDTPADVIEHAKNHVLKPIYQCIHCEYKTIWKWNMRKHLFNIHEIVSQFPDQLNISVSHEMIDSRGVGGQKRKRQRRTIDDGEEMLIHGGKQIKTQEEGTNEISSLVSAMEVFEDARHHAPELILKSEGSKSESMPCTIQNSSSCIGSNMESSSPVKIEDDDTANQNNVEDSTNLKLISVKCEQNSTDASDTNDCLLIRTDETEQDLKIKPITALNPKLGKPSKINKTKKIVAKNENGSNESKIDDRCRPWKCSMCDKRSNWRYDVRNHIALHHPGATLIKLSEQEARASFAVLVDKFMEQRKLTKGSSPIKQRMRFDLSKMRKNKDLLNCTKLLWDTGLTDTVEETNSIASDQTPSGYENLASESQSKTLMFKNIDNISMSESLISESENKYEISKHEADSPGQSASDVNTLESVKTNDDDMMETVVPVDTIHSNPDPLEYVANPDQINDESLQKWVDHLKLKRFKCSGCPYRSNFRGDLSRHIKMRHRATSLCVVRVLTIESAAATVGQYRFKWAMEANRLAGTESEMIDDDAGVMEYDENQQDNKNNEAVVPVIKQNRMNHRFKAPSKKRSAYSDDHGTSRIKIRQHATDDARKCCTVCPFITDKSGHLKLHMSYHTPQPRNTYQCQYCPFYVRTARLLDSHLLLHLPKIDAVGAVVVVGHEEGNSESQTVKKSGVKYKYICDQCPYVSYFRNDYWLHRRHHFEKECTPLKCSFCRYWADEERLITQHELLHVGTYCPKWIPPSSATAHVVNSTLSPTNDGECRCSFAERCEIRFSESLRCGREIQCPYCCYTVVSMVLMRQHYITHVSCTDAKSTPLFSATLDTADDFLTVPCRQKIRNDPCEASSVNEAAPAEFSPAPVLEREILLDDIFSSQSKSDSDLVFEPLMPVLEHFIDEVVEINKQQSCHSRALTLNDENDVRGAQFTSDLKPTKLKSGPSSNQDTILGHRFSPINTDGEEIIEANLNVKNHSTSQCKDILEQAMQMAGMLNIDSDDDDSGDVEDILRNTEDIKHIMGVNNDYISGVNRGEELNRTIVEVLPQNCYDTKPLPNSPANCIVSSEVKKNSNLEEGSDCSWKLENIVSDKHNNWTIDDIVGNGKSENDWKVEDVIGNVKTKQSESNVQIIAESSDKHAVVKNEAEILSSESVTFNGEHLNIFNQNIDNDFLDSVETPMLIPVVYLDKSNAALGSDCSRKLEDIVSDMCVDTNWEIEDVISNIKTETNEPHVQINAVSSDKHAIVKKEEEIGSSKSTSIDSDLLDSVKTLVLTSGDKNVAALGTNGNRKFENIISVAYVDTDWKIEDIIDNGKTEITWKIEDIVGNAKTKTNESNVQIIANSSRLEKDKDVAALCSGSARKMSSELDLSINDETSSVVYQRSFHEALGLMPSYKQ